MRQACDIATHQSAQKNDPSDRIGGNSDNCHERQRKTIGSKAAEEHLCRMGHPNRPQLQSLIKLSDLFNPKKIALPNQQAPKDDSRFEATKDKEMCRKADSLFRYSTVGESDPKISVGQMRGEIDTQKDKSNHLYLASYRENQSFYV
jgi:hypothetical protein